MSSIIENLHKILTSRYGRDVRQAIHDAIEDCYEDGRAISINVDPKVTTGTNIADIEINDTTYSLYAEGTVVSIDPKVTEGINIADITVDGQTTSLYGGSATIGGLTDVDITNPTEGEELSYDDTDNKWVNRTTRIECTMAQYEAWEQGGTLLSDVEYYVTDAPSSEGVAIDDTTASTTTVYSSSKVEDLLDDKADSATTYTKTEVDTALSGKASTSSVSDIVTQLNGYIFTTYTLDGNGALLTLPSYNDACLIFISRGGAGVFMGHWTGVTPIVNDTNFDVRYYSNPSRINITNNSPTTARITVIRK